MAETIEERTDARAQPVETYAESLWQAVIEADEHEATDVVMAALDAGVDPEAILLDIVGATQRRVGMEWAANRISVAQEHAATAINERVIVHLSGRLPRQQPTRARVAVACVDGEWHALPARLLAEVLTLRGFRVDYLGAQVPTPHLITHLHRTSPDVVALSGSIPTRLPVAHATITACQSAGVPVIVGGSAFGVGGRWATLLGADAWAPDAAAAVERLSRPLPRPQAPHQPIDDLPHLADQEYTMVARSAPRLVRAVMTGLEERLPMMRDYSDLQRQHTAEDVAQIVDFLAAALYVGDAALFCDFLAWTAEVLEARAVPARSLVPAVELLRDELRDFERAVAMLDQAWGLLQPR
ncbi:cobalamin-dependent protein [Nocardioides sp. BP30]|uniref:cobalamin B12-binding domain-containing protein n=1 Tax=Nocardioides sp. BP30 TaxID=3036374 RepID=UPI0024691315|nr:cobalamin-dependent protein [Nocardioides sp. BP30]WGL53386.1 cobalamin-dependent protein [Nocardioides sp. BP30]